MNPYSNLPPEQRPTQRLVDQFNADERLWKKLEPKRAARRKTRPRLKSGKLKKLALLQFAKASPLPDCIGEPCECPGTPRPSDALQQKLYRKPVGAAQTLLGTKKA